MGPDWPDLPRLSFVGGPTPLTLASNLSEVLGGPRIWLKRDDLTPIALGGNKLRKLEYLLADALDSDADLVVTAGAIQSNHCVQTAAACNRIGLDCELVLRGDPAAPLRGNLLIDHLLGARVHLQPMRMDERNTYAEQLVADRAAAGRRPYFVPVGGSNGLGVIGYAQALFELAEQSRAAGFTPAAVVSASGSGGTQAGLALGAAALGHPFEVHGVSVRRERATLAPRVAALASEGAALVGESEMSADEIIVHDGYVGAGYGELTDGVLEAIRLLGATEGVLMDPVYTGKAMSGLIGEVRAGRWGAEDNVVFVHTGGTPALHAYGERLLG